MRCLDDITNSMDMNLGKLQEMVKGKEAWSAAVHGLAESATWQLNNNNIINIDNNNVNMQSLVHTDILPKFPSPQNVAEKWVWWVGWENENFSKGKVKKKESSYSWIATDCPAPGSFFLLSYMR